MAAQSKSTSTRRKSKSVSIPKAIQLTPDRIRAYAEEQAVKEYWDFIKTATPAEMKIVGKLRRCDFVSIEVMMKEVRRLLGESIAKCKVIPFPAKCTTIIGG